MSFIPTRADDESCVYRVSDAILSDSDISVLENHMEDNHPEVKLSINTKESLIEFGWPKREQLERVDFEDMKQTVEEPGFGFSLRTKLDVVFLDDGSRLVKASENVEASQILSAVFSSAVPTVIFEPTTGRSIAQKGTVPGSVVESRGSDFTLVSFEPFQKQ